MGSPLLYLSILTTDYSIPPEAGPYYLASGAASFGLHPGG